MIFLLVVHVYSTVLTCNLYREVLAEISRHKEAIQSAKEELQDLDRQETHQKRVLQSKQEKLTKQRLKQEAKVNSTRQAMDELHR